MSLPSDGEEAETYLASLVIMERSPTTEGDEDYEGEERTIKLSHALKGRWYSADQAYTHETLIVQVHITTHDTLLIKIIKNHEQ